jgi:excisionase family DNA binding protein
MDTQGDIERLTYSVDEAATAAGISRATVYRLIDRGALHTIKLGDRRLVPREALERLCNPERAA